MRRSILVAAATLLVAGGADAAPRCGKDKMYRPSIGKCVTRAEFNRTVRQAAVPKTTGQIQVRKIRENPEIHDRSLRDIVVPLPDPAPVQLGMMGADPFYEDFLRVRLEEKAREMVH